MTKTLFIAAALMLASCAQEHFESIQQTAEAEFIDMVTKKLGWGTGWTLLNYGCHCGPDSPDWVIWLDDVDNCCRIHDEAYLAAPKKFEGCNCRTRKYAFTFKDGVVTCAAEQVNECATYCCAEDKKFVDCVAGAGPLDPKLAKIDRKTRCPLAECGVDEDCDGGYYCDRGICRMYCDPGDWGSALSTVCDSPGDETVDTTEQLAAPDGSGSGAY